MNLKIGDKVHYTRNSEGYVEMTISHVDFKENSAICNWDNNQDIFLIDFLELSCFKKVRDILEWKKIQNTSTNYPW